MFFFASPAEAPSFQYTTTQKTSCRARFARKSSTSSTVAARECSSTTSGMDQHEGSSATTQCELSLSLVCSLASSISIRPFWCKWTPPGVTTPCSVRMAASSWRMALSSARMASSSLLGTEGVLVAGAKNFIAAAAEPSGRARRRPGAALALLVLVKLQLIRASGFTLITSTILY